MTEVSIVAGRENMDVAMVHRFLNEDSYWAKGISYELVDQSLANSFCAGAFIDGRQVAFGRVITDYSTFGWFADFFVLPAHRGKGISKMLLSFIAEQPWYMRLRRKMLNTRDAHGLYRQFQFQNLSSPANVLEIYNPTVHLQ
ncbi:MAG TPA: GNAT family N-acetyltransferase [Puia sp.]|nr:GNAT family N-acetyltransferase [Puia sp.]